MRQALRINFTPLLIAPTDFIYSNCGGVQDYPHDAFVIFRPLKIREKANDRLKKPQLDVFPSSLMVELCLPHRKNL
jgi:hypothetical protein